MDSQCECQPCTECDAMPVALKVKMYRNAGSYENGKQVWVNVDDQNDVSHEQLDCADTDPVPTAVINQREG